MSPLTSADMAALVRAIRYSGASSDLDTFAWRAAAVVRTVVAGDVAAYAEVNTKKHTQRHVADPIDFEFAPGSLEYLAAHPSEHPVLAWHQESGQGDPRAISDLITQSEYHRRALYEVAMEPIHAEDQISIGLPFGLPLAVAIALNRDRIGFSERDRDVLAVLREHLAAMYRTAQARTHITSALKSLASSVEEGGYSVIVLRADGRVAFASPRAQVLLRRYLGAGRRGRVPEPLASWTESRRVGSEALAIPENVFVVARDDVDLVVRFVPAGDGQPNEVLMLHERRHAPTFDLLERVGLTPREREVVELLVMGKSNTEIAEALNVRPSTARKHLENIYAKLGVDSRTAAVARVWALTEGWHTP